MVKHMMVVTAADGVDALDAETISTLAGESAVWLDDDAIELPANADQLAAVRAQFGHCYDVNLVPVDNRRKKLLIADMDSTIIPVECIDEIAGYAGVKSEVAEITERAMQGELDFEGALKARVALLAGLPVEKLQQTYDECITLNPGAKALVGAMNKAGAVTALVSGGFTFFSSLVGRDAGFQRNQANVLLFESGKLTGKVGLPVLGREAKLETMQSICAECGFDVQDALAVGDGANDLAMVEAAGLGVAYHAKAALAERADATIYHSDLTALLRLQGM